MGTPPEYDEAVHEVTESFPGIDEIEDTELQKMIKGVWATALVRSEYSGIEEPDFLVTENENDESLVSHTRDVTQCAVALTDTLIEARGSNIDRDAVVAGALLHDVSKLHETSPDSARTPLGEQIPHPHYAVHMLENAGVPPYIQHIVLTHTHKSGPTPNSIEARIVMAADVVAADTVFWDTDETLNLLMNTELR